MSLFQIQIVRMVEVTERQEPKLWCGFAVILIKAKPVVPVTDIVNSADKVTKESVVWRRRWKCRQICKNSNRWASHQITDQTLKSDGCSSHWQHVFELQTRGCFFDTFPSVDCQTEHLKAQIGEEFLCTLASSHLMWWSDKRWGWIHQNYIPRSGHSATIVHHYIEHLKGSHTVIAKLPLWQQGGWKSRQALSCEKW